MTRILFCGFFALIVAFIPYYFEPGIGTFLFVGVAWICWIMTQPYTKDGKVIDPMKELLR